MDSFITFSADQNLTQFTYQLSVPSIYDIAGNVQRLDDFRVTATPQPTETKEATDQYGNRSRKLIWRKLNGDVQVSISYTTGITATISPRISRAPLPLNTVPEAERSFLKRSSKGVLKELFHLAPVVLEMTHVLSGL